MASWYSTATQLKDGTALVGFPVHACSTTQAKARARQMIESAGFPVDHVYYSDRRGPNYRVSLWHSEKFAALEKFIPADIISKW